MEEPVVKHTTIAVDLSKTVFEIALSNHPGRVCERKRLSRTRLASFFSNRPAATVLLEACGSAHHWARQLQSMGHRVLLLPPHQTRRYVLRDKTDSADAEALLEAHRNEKILPVPIKTIAQQTLTALHRIRSGWIQTRTARLNAIRGILRELGLFIPQGSRHVLPALTAFLSDPRQPIPVELHPCLLAFAAEIRTLEQNIRDIDRRLNDFARRSPDASRLLTIPGIGVLSATALIGFVGPLDRFRSGRRFSSSLGIVPREHSSGPRRHLGSITKRGDPYLRTLLIHAARSALLAASRAKQPDRLQAWALRLKQRRGYNCATVALANKVARIAWALCVHQSNYQSATA
jgi:transposase